MKKIKKKSIITTWFKSFLIAIALLWITKTFFIDITTISNQHMEETLKKGDVMLINKLIPGPRMPITLISIPFFGTTFPFTSTKTYLDLIRLPYWRITLNNIKRNDLVAFNNPIENDPPIDKKNILIKRCIGLPGDTLKIHDKKIFVNNHLINDQCLCKYRYRISSNKELNQDFFNKYQINNYLFISKPFIYEIFATSAQADSLSKNPLIKKIHILKLLDPPKNIRLFPYSIYISWSNDYYGPIYVPKKNTKVNLTKYNIDLYKKIISDYENHQLAIENDSIFIIDGIKTQTYIFKYNYYFVMDDNRDQAYDSRYWGFVPENHIIGKANFILFNIDTIQHRTFKTVE